MAAEGAEVNAVQGVQELAARRAGGEFLAAQESPRCVVAVNFGVGQPARDAGGNLHELARGVEIVNHQVQGRDLRGMARQVAHGRPGVHVDDRRFQYRVAAIDFREQRVAVAVVKQRRRGEHQDADEAVEGAGDGDH